jgi:tetratricopeptide (TPR) repeat protein
MKRYLFLLLLPVFILAASAQQSPKTEDALLLEYYQNQRFAEAADYLKKTYPEPIAGLKILSRLAYTTQMAGRLPEAEEYYQRVFVADTTNTAILYSLGSINSRRGNNLKALNFYKKILLKDSSNFNVYKQLANLSQSTGNIGAAIIYFQKANKINPVEPDVAYYLTSLYISLKQYNIADTIVIKALQADTANLLLLFSKAQVNYRLEKFAETIVVCNKLITAGDQNGMIINMLGSSYYRLKKYTLCISAYLPLEKSKTATETSYYYTAMSYKALGNQLQAVNYFDKAIKEAVSINVDSYYSEMGDSYDSLHQLKNAVNAYQKSLLYAVKPITYYALANLYDSELKNKTLAVRYYRKYLKSALPEKQRTYALYAKRRLGELGR